MQIDINCLFKLQSDACNAIWDYIEQQSLGEYIIVEYLIINNTRCDESLVKV